MRRTNSTDGCHLENKPTHSKAKLALAILTSPGAAFEEILRRKLLGTGLVIVAMAGVASTIAAIERAAAGSPIQFFALGRYNPFTWFGLFLLYAFAIQQLLRWLRTEVEYGALVTVMAWAQVPLLLAHVVAVAAGLVGIFGEAGTVAPQFMDSLGAVLQIAYVAVVGVGISTLCGGPLSRGLMSYLVVQFAITIAFGVTYASSRTKLLTGGLASIYRAGQAVAAVDMIPWLAASVVGLGIGLWHLAKHLGWKRDAAFRAVAGAAVVGGLCLGSYLYAFISADYYGRLLSIQQAYDTDKFDRAAREFGFVMSLARHDDALGMDADLDLGRINYLRGRLTQSLRHYHRAVATIKHADTGKNEPFLLAQPYSEIGAVYDAQREYDKAIKQFELSSKSWPDFRDPWVRMAVTYNRMGRYKDAIEAGEHATKKLGSKSPIAFLALAEAYAHLGDTRRSEAAAKRVGEIDEDLAKRIGSDPNNWKNAIAKLTSRDLKFPLEKEPARPTPRQQAAKKPAKR
jgi:tetratricopeptide (TPR) repeat protein